MPLGRSTVFGTHRKKNLVERHLSMKKIINRNPINWNKRHNCRQSKIDDEISAKLNWSNNKR